MSCGSLTPATTRSLTAVSTSTVQYEWYTDWLPCFGLDYITAVLKNKAVSGNFRSQLAVQYASVRTDNPDSPGTLGVAQTGAGERCDDNVNVGTGGANKFFLRFGVAYDMSAAGNPARADVELQVSYNSCGRVVGAFNQQLVASSGSNNSYVAVTPWIPTIAAAKMRAALSITSLTGDFQCRMAYRTAETSQQSPNGWSTTFDSTWRTAGEATTNDLTPTYSDVMWVQFGLQYNLSSGTPGQASVACAVAVQK